jgi:GntR family transcriptional regulator/MocR family aminotransferase
VPFRVGEPALDLFPVDIWARLYARHARRGARDFLGYGHANGYPPLRRAVAEYVSAARGVRADPGQVILVRGAQQAVDLIARTVFRPGDRVWYEDPGYLAAAAILRLAGTSLVPVPVDAQGLRVDVGENSAADAKGVHVAPSHQFPMGSALSLERRLALLAWAGRARAWVIEDDYDSEFRYPGHPLPALQGLDAAGRVIYVGTFSKTVFPALRLGYLIAPPDLVDRLTHAAAQVDHLAPTLEQAVLTDFIEEGHFTRHVRRMRKAYAERQQALIAAVDREMAGLLRIEPADAGMHVIGWLPPSSDDAAVSSRALELGVEVPALSRYRLRAPLAPGLLLGFAALRPTAMTTALRKLRKAIEGGPAQ